MRRILAHVLRLHLGPFFLGFSVVTFLLTTDFLLEYLDLLINKGVAPLVVIQLFLFALGWMIALSVPCGVLVAVLMAFGRMAQDNEITALRASGMNPATILLAPLALAALLAGSLAYFNDRILPNTNHAYANLLMDIARKRPAVEVREGVLMTDIEGYALRASQVDARTSMMNGVVLVQQGAGVYGHPTTIVARRGQLAYRYGGSVLTLTLWDGEIHQTDSDRPHGYTRVHFGRETINIQGMSAELMRSDRDSRGDREMSTADMQSEIASLEHQRGLAWQRLAAAGKALGYASGEAAMAARAPTPWQAWRLRLHLAPPDTVHVKPNPTELFLLHRELDAGHAENELSMARMEYDNADRRIDALQVEIHKKYAIPFACVIFVLLGAPLGMRARRGGMTAGFLSLGFFVIYYLFLIGGEQLADRQLLPPAVAMWAANVVLGAIGVLLTLGVCDIRLLPARRRQGRSRPWPDDLDLGGTAA